MNIQDDRILQNFHVLTTINTSFCRDADKIRQKLINIDELSPLFKECAKDGLFVELSNKSNKIFKKEVSKLAIRYNLSSAYHNLIESYLQDGMVPHFFKRKGPFEPFLAPNPNNKLEKFVVLALPQELSISDLQKYWKHITSKRDYLLKQLGQKPTKPQKLSPRKRTMRDIDIYNFKESGYKAKEITKLINKRYPEDPISYEEISKIIIRLKKVALSITMGQAR